MIKTSVTQKESLGDGRKPYFESNSSIVHATFDPKFYLSRIDPGKKTGEPNPTELILIVTPDPHIPTDNPQKNEIPTIPILKPIHAIWQYVPAYIRSNFRELNIRPFANSEIFHHSSRRGRLQGLGELAHEAGRRTFRKFLRKKSEKQEINEIERWDASVKQEAMMTTALMWPHILRNYLFTNHEKIFLNEDGSPKKSIHFLLFNVGDIAGKHGTVSDLLYADRVLEEIEHEMEKTVKSVAEKFGVKEIHIETERTQGNHDWGNTAEEVRQQAPLMLKKRGNQLYSLRHVGKNNILLSADTNLLLPSSFVFNVLYEDALTALQKIRSITEKYDLQELQKWDNTGYYKELRDLCKNDPELIPLYKHITTYRQVQFHTEQLKKLIAHAESENPKGLFLLGHHPKVDELTQITTAEHIEGAAGHRHWGYTRRSRGGQTEIHVLQTSTVDAAGIILKRAKKSDMLIARLGGDEKSKIDKIPLTQKQILDLKALM